MAHNRAAKVAPSHYPRLIFHTLRCAQLLSAIVVSGIMCYFMYYLHREHYLIPWTFITLIVISIVTMASLLVTIILYNFTFLSPKFNLSLNTTISIFWALGLALLTWSLNPTLHKACDSEHWGSEAGMMVCRVYKTLWSFTLCGFVSTILALCLDIHTNRKATKLGVYVLPEDDKNALKMQEMKPARVMNGGYELPKEQGMGLVEKDIGGGGVSMIHSRYGQN
jgi:hypothetical protein